MKPVKSKEERLKEALEFRRKFQSIGLSSEIPEIGRIFDILSEYVIDGKSASGTIKGPIINKIIVYNLRPQENKISEIVLRKL